MHIRRRPWKTICEIWKCRTWRWWWKSDVKKQLGTIEKHWHRYMQHSDP